MPSTMVELVKFPGLLRIVHVLTLGNGLVVLSLVTEPL